MTSAVADIGTREAVERLNEAAERMDVEALRAAIIGDWVFDSPAPGSDYQCRWPSHHSSRPVVDKGPHE